MQLRQGGVYTSLYQEQFEGGKVQMAVPRRRHHGRRHHQAPANTASVAITYTGHDRPVQGSRLRTYRCAEPPDRCAVADGHKAATDGPERRVGARLSGRWPTAQRAVDRRRRCLSIRPTPDCSVAARQKLWTARSCTAPHGFLDCKASSNVCLTSCQNPEARTS
jgi:hypothetical protein